MGLTENMIPNVDAQRMASACCHCRWLIVPLRSQLRFGDDGFVPAQHVESGRTVAVGERGDRAVVDDGRLGGSVRAELGAPLLAG